MKTIKDHQEKKLKNLFLAISLIRNEKEADAFFTDLCTPMELEAMAGRWAVIPLLKQGVPYRTINEQTGVSVATITRIARCLIYGEGGYDLIYQRLEDT